MPHRSPDCVDVQIHVCGSCESPLVQPVEWHRMPGDHWQIELRCPECEWHGTGVYTADEVAAFDEEIERGTDTLLADLSALAEANFEDEIDSFAAALQAGAILADDF